MENKYLVDAPGAAGTEMLYHGTLIVCVNPIICETDCNIAQRHCLGPVPRDYPPACSSDGIFSQKLRHSLHQFAASTKNMRHAETHLKAISMTSSNLMLFAVPSLKRYSHK